jgi:hypothetical protein
MNIITGVASVGLFTLALVSPPGTGILNCANANDTFQSAMTKVVEALRAYEQCIAASKGKDKCASEIQALDDAHDDLEDAVDDYKQACP